MTMEMEERCPKCKGRLIITQAGDGVVCESCTYARQLGEVHPMVEIIKAFIRAGNGNLVMHLGEKTYHLTGVRLLEEEDLLPDNAFEITLDYGYVKTD